MPPIPVPRSNPALPQTIFSGDQFGALEARADQEIAQAGRNLGQALENRQTQREVSKLNAEFAKAQADLTVSWQEALRTADPNDDGLAARFQQEQVGKRLEQLKGLANTREAKDYYTRLSSGLGANFQVQTAAGQAGLAERAAVANWQTTKNQFSDALTADPYSFDTTLATVDIALDGLVAANGLSTEKRLVLEQDAKGDLAMAAARARIERDPDEGVAFVESGGYSEYLDASQKAQLAAYGRSFKNAQEAARKEELNAAVAERRTYYVRSLIDPKTGSVNKRAVPALMRELARDPILNTGEGAAEQQTLFNVLKQELDSGRDASKTAGQDRNFGAFMKRAITGELSDNEILMARANGDISGAQVNELFDVTRGKDTPRGRLRLEGTKQLEAIASANLKLDDPFADIQKGPAQERYGQAMLDVKRWLAEREQSGQTGLEDPKVYNEAVGRINARTSGIQQDIRRTVEGVSGTTAPAKKFNSIAEYEAAKAGAK